MDMKARLILLALAAVAGALAAPAQLRYGVRLGGDFAALRLNDADGCGLRNRSGFSGGLVLEYQLPRCGFAPDIAVVYTRRNSRLTLPDGSRASFGRDFIEIPLHLKYKFWLSSTKKLVGPMVYAGPVMSVRVGDSGSGPLRTHRVQPGLDVGVGIDVVNFIQIAGGYRFGLGNASDSFTGWPDSTLRTDAWTVSATILFDF